MSAEPPKKRGREGSPPEEEGPDEVVVKVEEREFPCKKSHLAAHSQYFQRKFFSSLAERERKELVLKGVREQDFDLFLEVIDGTGEVTDENILPLLRLTQYLEASGAERKCLQFLMVDSEKEVKEKFQLADRYRLEPLIVQILSDIHTPEELRAIAPLIDVPTWNHKTLNHVLQKMYSLLGLQGDYFRGRADAEPVHVQIQQPRAPERAPQQVQHASDAQANQPRQPTPPNRVPDGPLMVREARTLAVELAAFLERHQNPQNPVQTQLHIVRIAALLAQAAGKAQNRLGEDAPQNQAPRRLNTHGLPVQNQDARPAPQSIQAAAQAQNQANQPRHPAPPNRTADEMQAALREQMQQNLIQAPIPAQMAQVGGQAQNHLGEDAPQIQAPRRFNFYGTPVQNQDARGPQLNQVVAQAQNQANQPRQPAPLNRFDDEMRAAIREQIQNRQNPFLQLTAAQQVQIQEASQNQAPRRCITHGLPVLRQTAQAHQPNQFATQAQNQAIQPRQPAPLNRFDDEMRAAIRERHQSQQNQIQAQLAVPTAQVVGQDQDRLGEVAPQNQAPRRFNFYSMPIQNQNAQTAQPNQALAQNPYYIARRAQMVQPIVTGDAAAREHAQRVFLAGNRNPVLNQQNPAQAPYQATMPRLPPLQNHAPMLPSQVPVLNQNVLGPNRPVTDNGAVQNPVPQNQIQPVQPAGEQLIQLLLPEDRALGAQLYATLEAMKARSRAAHVEAPNPQGQGQVGQVAERQEPAE